MLQATAHESKTEACMPEHTHRQNTLEYAIKKAYKERWPPKMYVLASAALRRRNSRGSDLGSA